MKSSRRLVLFLSAFALMAGLVAALTRPQPVAAFSSDLTAAENQYPSLMDTKLDDCTLCHTASGFALNPYGAAYLAASHSFSAIEAVDSDQDGFTNIAEINALTFPGNASDNPGGPVTSTPTATATSTPTATATDMPTVTPTATQQAGGRKLYLPLVMKEIAP